MTDYPRTLIEFQHLFPDETACARHIERIRWPKGFKCPSCSQVGDPWRLHARPRVIECRHCGYQVSLTAGTVMHRTRQPLPIWFWAAYLVTTQTPGMSALQLQRQLGIRRYETAFQMLHKLRAAMVRPDRDRIGAEWPPMATQNPPLVAT
jgi:DNA-directed RNA polymerase subunit RPC12/RpoP